MPMLLRCFHGYNIKYNMLLPSAPQLNKTLKTGQLPVNSYFYSMSGHAEKCVEKYCELANCSASSLPIYLNHYSVVSSMKSLAAEPDAANMSEARLRDLLSRKFSTSYVKHVNARDIEIIRGTGVEIVAEYEVREDLIGNLDAVVTFKRVQPLN